MGFVNVSLLEGDGIPLAFLYRIDVTFALWVCCHVKPRNWLMLRPQHQPQTPPW